MGREGLSNAEIAAQSACLEWFKIHADQRMKLFNFYLLFLGGIVLLGSIILEQEHALIRMFGGGFIVWISLVFRELDRRISELIKGAEKGLIEIEQRQAERIGANATKVVLSAQAKDQTWSYSKCFHFVFLGGSIVGAVLLLDGWRELIAIQS